MDEYDIFRQSIIQMYTHELCLIHAFTYTCKSLFYIYY